MWRRFLQDLKIEADHNTEKQPKIRFISQRFLTKRRLVLFACPIIFAAFFGGQTSTQVAAVPFPTDTTNNYLLGVGSYFSAFAADNLVISPSSITQFEGRYAGKNISVSSDIYNWDEQYRWFELKRFAPALVTNSVNDNLFHLLNTEKIIKPGSDPQRPTYIKAVINNLTIPTGQLVTNDSLIWKRLIEVPTNQESTDMKDRTYQKVGQVDYFKDNANAMATAYQQQTGETISLDPTDADASNYFTAAASQINEISKYYQSFTANQAVVSNFTPAKTEQAVADATTQEVGATLSGGDTADPILTINLPADYQTSYSKKPPLIFVNLSGKPKNITINMNGLATDMNLNAEEEGQEQAIYPAFKYAPYIIFNWNGITDTMSFTWGDKFTFNVTDQNGAMVKADEATKAALNEAGLSETLATGVTNNQVLSSRILHNFPTATTSDGNFLLIQNSDADGNFSGSVLAPNASFKIGNAQTYFYGNVISGKNVTIENNMKPVRVISGNFNVSELPTDTVEEIDPNLRLTKVTVSQGEKNISSVSFDGKKAGAEYNADYLTGPLNLSLSLHPNQIDYQIFYRFLAGSTPGWHRLELPKHDYQEEINELTDFKVADLAGYQAGIQPTTTTNGLSAREATSFDPLTLKDGSGQVLETKTLGVQLARNNQLQLVVVPKHELNGSNAEITAINLDDFLQRTGEKYPPFLLTLSEAGNLQVTLPNYFPWVQETTGSLSAQLPVTIRNDWNLPVTLDLERNEDETLLNALKSDESGPIRFLIRTFRCSWGLIRIR
ncbi:hypothetical protein [Lapidilactobacillus salsurivasis]